MGGQETHQKFCSECGNPLIAPPSGPNIILRLLYFVAVGWWLGLIVSVLTWFLNITLIGLPLGLWLINRLLTIMTMRPQEQTWKIKEGVLVKGKDQRAFLVRALYFIAIGWWFSAVWLVLAYVLVFTIIGIVLAFWMYGACRCHYYALSLLINERPDAVGEVRICLMDGHGLLLRNLLTVHEQCFDMTDNGLSCHVKGVIKGVAA